MLVGSFVLGVPPEPVPVDGIRRVALNRREPLTIKQRIAMERCKLTDALIAL